jgi:hypothetical protein
MNMPGFTADVSLAPTSTHYRTSMTATSQSTNVVPQLMKGGFNPALECLAFCFCCGRYANSYCCILCDICTIVFSDPVFTL